MFQEGFEHFTFWDPASLEVAQHSDNDKIDYGHVPLVHLLVKVQTYCDVSTSNVLFFRQTSHPKFRNKWQRYKQGNENNYHDYKSNKYFNKYVAADMFHLIYLYQDYSKLCI